MPSSRWAGMVTVTFQPSLVIRRIFIWLPRWEIGRTSYCRARFLPVALPWIGMTSFRGSFLPSFRPGATV